VPFLQTPSSHANSLLIERNEEVRRCIVEARTSMHLLRGRMHRLITERAEIIQDSRRCLGLHRADLRVCEEAGRTRAL
jgi:hypothetical protein